MEIKKYLKLNNSENNMYQNWGDSKSALGNDCIILSACRREKRLLMR